jgi:hypothetical protein
MLRKTMIALCAMASIGMLAPDLALARGGGGGGGGHGGGGGFGGHGGFGPGGGFGGHAGGFGSSFARTAPGGGVGMVQGNRFAGNFGHRGFHDGRGFRRGFVAGGWWGPGYDYWDYPDYAYDDTYYDNGGCYIVQRRVHTAYGWRVRPIQVCG